MAKSLGTHSSCKSKCLERVPLEVSFNALLCNGSKVTHLNTGLMTDRMLPNEALPTSSRKQFSANEDGSIFLAPFSESVCSSGWPFGLLPSFEILLGL